VSEGLFRKTEGNDLRNITCIGMKGKGTTELNYLSKAFVDSVIL
jgi:hypothetical protein